MVRGPYLPSNPKFKNDSLGSKGQLWVKGENGWLSVIAKQGVHVVVPSKVIRCCWDDTFAELLSKAAPEITIWPKSQGSRTTVLDSITDQFL